MSQKDNSKVEKKSYSETLHLPRTDFPIRAQASIDDELVLKRWAELDLYKKAYTLNQGKESFILHDGPPYANGNIHIGHAYNKILKDIVAKSERMRGKHVPVVPGWDCHGLPIELKVMQNVADSSDRVAVKQACRAYAAGWVKIQSQEFQKLGVVMNWDQPYLTMNYEYQADILRSFAAFFEQGYVRRQQKTVPWCSSCETVLANAEIEHKERKDPSVYVEFPLQAETVVQLFPEVKDVQVSLLVWTTTPWTLPLNRAVALKPGAEYQLIKIKEKYVVCAKDVVEKISQIVESSAEIITTILADRLIGVMVSQPLRSGRLVPVIENHLISLTDGTACVHIAPGCGPEDYDLGVKNSLEIFSPITSNGSYSSEIEIAELVGMKVQDGQWWVLKKLAELDTLFFKTSLKHAYPHCWRCQNGLIFRATNQWFCDLSKNDLRKKALEAIDHIEMLPATGANRLKSSVEGRLEWCLSRQRTWGIPIPALRCDNCEHVFLDKEVVHKVADSIEREGVEFWDQVQTKELLTENFSCARCSHKSFSKEFDILDVWFDSGVSHAVVLKHFSGQSYPADLYLEGKDQHRGWFQSSLLTSLILSKEPAMRSILTHGFTVDARGHKMSKSQGNVVIPDELIAQLGTDGVRLWVASNDYESDPVVSDVLMKNVAEVYRKIRNTCRFLLSNLYDFDMKRDAVPFDQLLIVDQYALCDLSQFQERVLQAYQDRKTTVVFHELADYCVKSLSAFYLDVSKDRLYVEGAQSHERRSAQTAYYHILDAMTKLMAPILSFTSELISDHYQSARNESVHLGSFADLSWIKDNGTSVLMRSALEIRSFILKELEILRTKGDIKHSLDAQVDLYIAEDRIDYKKCTAQIAASSASPDIFWKDLCIVSQFSLHNSVQNLKEVVPGLCIKVSKADGFKCNRCWQWEANETHNTDLCQRCKGVLGF
jgi:isoleucyl-tRNA synthetase